MSAQEGLHDDHQPSVRRQQAGGPRAGTSCRLLIWPHLQRLRFASRRTSGAEAPDRSLPLQLETTGLAGIDIGEAAVPAFEPASGALWLAPGHALSRLPMSHAAGAPPSSFQLPPGMGGLMRLQISRAGAATIWGAARVGLQTGVAVMSELGAQSAWLPSRRRLTAPSRRSAERVNRVSTGWRAAAAPPCPYRHPRRSIQ